MKFNKWTLGLAAVGAVSLASTVRADELKALNTAISNTTISGVIDVAAQYNPGNVHNGGYSHHGFNYNSKLDAFSVNQVIITLDKPLDESPWASGYHVDLNWGSDAVGIMNTPVNSYSDSYSGFAGIQSPMRQAYVTMRTPIGNGIDWKAGLFDNILGYESNTLSSNPNYTHSVAWGYEPTSQLGLIGTYKVCESLAVTAGLANSYSGYYGYYGNNVSEKTILGALTMTAPDSWGWAKGSAFTVGVNQGFYKYSVNNYYAGLTLPTPVEALKVGFAFDLVGNANEAPNNHKDDSIWIAGAYASFQATEKLSLNLRGEYIDGYSSHDRGEEVTLTAAYNLWANVVSRVELRWNHSDTGRPNGYWGYDSNQNSESSNGDGARSDDFMVAFNVAYRF